ESGSEILAFEHGRGQVTLITGLARFRSLFGEREYGLNDEDHAEILVALIATRHRGGDVQILARLDTPSLWEGLWDNARALLASAAVLLLLWLAHIVPRFQIMRPEPAPDRRSLVAHLRAIGRWLWRMHGASVLLE